MAVNKRLMEKYCDRRSCMKVLGCLMVEPKLLRYSNEPICSDYFPVRTHKVLFEVIEAIASTGQVETIGLSDIENWMYNNAQVSYNRFFETNDESEWILSLIEDADLGTYSYYLDIVRKYSFLRDKIASGQDVSDILDETLVDSQLLEQQRKAFFEMSLDDLIKHYDRKSLAVKSKYVMRSEEDSRKSGDGAEELWERFKLAPDYGWRSESKYLDTICRGCRRKMFVVESRDSGTGKTRLGVRQLCTLACDELWDYKTNSFQPNPFGETVPTLYIGTEMDLYEEIEPMIWSVISGVEEHKIKLQTYDEEEEARLLKAMEISKRSLIYLENEPNYSVEFFYSIVEKHVIEHNIGAVIVDYIERTPALISEYARMTRGMDISETQVLFNLSVELKNIAKRFNIFVKAYTQISDNARRDWQIRDSGAIKGSKSLQMKADLGIVAMRPVEKELRLLEEVIQKNGGYVPNIVVNVYKNRGGNYPPVRIFGMVNLGNMKFTDLFVTDWNYEQIKVSRAKLKALLSVEDIEAEVEVEVDSETGEIIEDAMEEEVVEEKPRSRRRRA